jgi:hypothetical protein
MNISFPTNPAQPYQAFNRSGNLSRTLQPGDTIRGTVVKTLGGDRYQISFQGNSLVVASPDALTEGMSIILLVEKVTDQVYARMLGTGNAAGQAVDPKQILAQLNVAPTGPALQLLTLLLENNLVFDAATFKNLDQLLAQIPQGTLDQKLQVLLYAFIQQLPSQPTVLNALWQLLYSRERFAQGLTALTAQLRDLIKQSGDTGNFKQALAFLEGLLVSPEAEDVAGQIKRYVQQSGMAYEQGILKGLIQPGAGAIGDLKELLWKLLSETDQFLPKETQETIKELMSFIEAEQLCSQADKATLNALWLVPIQDGAESINSQVELQHETQPPGEGRTRLRFTITTKNMGAVTAEVSIAHKMLDCSLACDTPDCTGYMQQHQDELLEKFRTLPFDLCNVECRTAEKTATMLQWLLAGGAGRKGSINIIA